MHPPHGSVESTDLRVVDSTAQLIEALRCHKLAAGDPSIREITRRVNRLRAQPDHRGPREPVVVSTVGYLFKSGRSRIDHDLFTDVLVALKTPRETLNDWDAAWRRAAGERPAPVLSVSTTVPSHTDRLVGRDQLLRTLQTHPEPIIALTGMPGVGKTRLACQLVESWCRQVVQAGSARPVVLHLRLGDSTIGRGATCHEILASIGVALGQAVSPTDDLTRLREEVRAAARSRPVVILIDDVESATQIAGLVNAASPTLRVVVTARRSLAGVSCVVIPLLCERHTAELIREQLSERAPSDDDVLRLQRVCAGNPQTVLTCCAAINTRRHVEIADHLDWMEAVRVPSGFESSMRLCYAGLGDAARRLLQLAGGLGGRIPPDSAFAAVAGDLDSAARAAARQQLASHHLLQAGGPGGDRVHGLVAKFAKKQAVRELPMSTQLTITRNLVQWACDQIAVDDDQWIPRHRGLLAAITMLTRELRLDEELFRISTACWPYVTQSRDVALGEAGTPWLDRHHEQVPPHMAAEALRRRAVIAWWQCGYDFALDAAHAAVRRARRSGDRLILAECLSTLGVLTPRDDGGDEARRYLDEALKLAREQQAFALAAKVLTNLVALHGEMGDLDSAAADLEQTLDLLAEAERRGVAMPRRIMATTQHARGKFALDSGRPAEAVPAFAEAAQIHLDLDNVYDGAASSAFQALALHRSGREADALVLFAEVEVTCDRLGSESLKGCLQRVRQLWNEPREVGETGKVTS